MATILRPNTTSADIIGHGLAQQLSRVGPGIAQALQTRADERQAMAKQERFAELLENQGIPREVAFLSPEEQRAYFSAVKAGGGLGGGNKPFKFNMSTLADYLKGESALGQNPNALRQVAPGEQPGRYAVSPEEAEQLRAQGIRVPLPEAPTTPGQLLGNVASGFTQGYLGRYGDILNLLPAVANLAGANLPYYQGTDTKAFAPNENEIQQVADRLGVEPDDPALLEMLRQGEFPTSEFRNPLKALAVPTSENLQDLAKFATKGTGAESYVTPQTQLAERAQKVGRAMSYLVNIGSTAEGAAKTAEAAGKSVPTAIAKAASKSMFKGLGVAIGGDAAGWAVKRAFGSELAGEIVSNALYMGYNLWPGSLKSAAKQEYNNFQTQVIDKAAEEGLAVNMTKYAKDARRIEDSIHKLVNNSEAQQWLGNEWAIRYGELFRKVQQDPAGLWNYVKEMGEKYRGSKIPEQAKTIYQQMIDLAEKGLKEFSDQVKPSGFQHLANADRLYRTNAVLFENASNLKKAVTTFSPGLAIMLMGGYKAVAGLGGAYFAGKYVSKMLADPTMRSLINQTAQASAANNVALMSKLAEKINKRAEEISPADARKLTELMRKNKISFAG